MNTSTHEGSQLITKNDLRIACAELKTWFLQVIFWVALGETALAVFILWVVLLGRK